MAIVTAAVYAASNTGAGIALTAAFDITFTDGRNKMGEFSLSLPSTHSSIALCTFGKVVRIAIDGVERFAGVIDSVERVRVDPGEEGIESTVVSGTGIGADLKSARVRALPPTDSPSTLAVLNPPVDDRPMEWFGWDFDRSSGWVSATVRGPHGETSSIYPGLPGGMRVLGANWIWSADAVGPEDDFLHFYEWIYLDIGEYVLDFAAYDAACFINGRRHSRNAAYGEKERVELEVVREGHLLLCFEADLRDPNFDEGLVWQITEGPDGDLVYASGTGMKVYSTPDAVLNMNPGEILLQLKKDHPSLLSGWTFNFSASVDSDGNAWGDTVAVSARIGDDSVWDVLEALSEVYVDFDFDVAGKTLNVWAKDAHNAVSTLELVTGYSTAAATSFVNVVGLEWEILRAPFNALQVRYEKGWIEVPVPMVGTPRWGPSLGIPHVSSFATAYQFGTAVLAAHGVDKAKAKLSLVDNLPDDQLPYVAFDKWSLIDVPNSANLDALTRVPVDEVKCASDEDGNLQVSLDLGSLVEEWQERLERWISRSTRGGLTGLVQMAQGIQESSRNRPPPLNYTEIPLFDAYNASAGSSRTRYFPVKGVAHKLMIVVESDAGGTSSGTVTINGVPYAFSGTTAAGFQRLYLNESLNVNVDQRMQANLSLTTVGHSKIAVIVGMSEGR